MSRIAARDVVEPKGKPDAPHDELILRALERVPVAAPTRAIALPESEPRSERLQPAFTDTELALIAEAAGDEAGGLAGAGRRCRRAACGRQEARTTVSFLRNPPA